MNKTATIYGINGPVIYLKGDTGFMMSEMVYVGKEKLVGEVISLDKDITTVQVYEETSGLKPGEIVEASGSPVSVTLAPGILNNIFDGIERPLEQIANVGGGAFITRGVSVDSLDRDKLWDTHITVAKGDYLHGGDIIAEVPETSAIVHKCMVPPDVEGEVICCASDGDYRIEDTLVTLRLSDGTEKQLNMIQHWPIRKARPTSYRFPASVPLITGQRILDTMFPIAKARETDTLGISSAQLADAVKEHGCDATYLSSFAAIEEFVTTHCQPGDLLITMGAGDVVTIGEDLLKA